MTLLPDSGAPGIRPQDELVDSTSAALWGSAEVAMVVIDRRLSIRAINACGARALGWRAEGGESLADLVAKDDQATLARLIAPDGNHATLHLLRAADSSLSTSALLVASVPLWGGAPGDELTLLIGRDASVEATREARLRRAQGWEIVGRVAYGIGHDLNNALWTITTLSELLLMDAAPESSIEKDLKAIKDSAWQAAAIARKLQLFAVDRAERADVPDEPTDVGEVAKGLDFLLRRFFPSNVSVVIEAQPSARARVSRPSVEEVIMALAADSRDAMPEGGTFRISVRPEAVGGARAGTAVVIEVSDDGPTDRYAATQVALEPLFSTKGGGAGLGLRAVETFVSEFGGVVALQANPGGGMMVRVVLPSAEG